MTSGRSEFATALNNVLLSPTLPHSLREELLPMELEFPLMHDVALLLLLLESLFGAIQRFLKTLTGGTKRVEAKFSETSFHLLQSR